MITMKQLRAFVKRRNKSEFQSNLQFGIDANASGFKGAELGEAIPFTVDGFNGYQWKVETNEGTKRLVEFGRQLYLQGEPGSDDMFELMNTATFVNAAVHSIG